MKTAGTRHATAATQSSRLQHSFLEQLSGPRGRPEPVQIVYGLDVPDDKGGLRISPAVEVADGAGLKLEPVSPANVIAMPDQSVATDADRSLCRLLGGSQNTVVAITKPPILDLVLKRLVESGRCRWRGGGITFAMGPNRRILAERHPRTEVLRFLGLDATVKVVEGNATWFIDTREGRIGKAEIQEVERQPIVQIKPPIGAKRGVAASNDPAVMVVDRQPVPILQAVSVTARQPDGGAETIDGVTLSFDYGAVIPEEDASQFVRVAGDDGLVFVRRDKAAEEAALEALEAVGMTALRLTGLDGKPLRRIHAHRGGDADDDWFRFATNDVHRLREDGWRIELESIARFQVIDAATDWDIAVGDGDDWFSIDVGIEVDGRRQPLLPLLVRLLNAGGKSALQRNDEGRVLARLDDGRLIALPAERVERFLDVLAELVGTGQTVIGQKMTCSTGELSALAELENVLGTRWFGGEDLREMSRRLVDPQTLPPIQPPHSFKADLRAYQRQGLAWLQYLHTNNMAGILADDMGLGKTAQTLAHIAVERSFGRMDLPSLVIVPTSLAPNWTAEAQRFVPDLKVMLFHGLDRHARRQEVTQAELVITTYAILARDVEFLCSIEWHLIVLDEAQAIKNPRAKSTRAACQLRARHRLCLSGTPIENHLGELWSQFAFLMPGLLGDHRGFSSRFRAPIERQGDATRREALARRVKPFLLRRTKSEVATDLPPKTEIVRRIDLEGGQRDLYETVRLSVHDRVRQEIARAGLPKSRVIVLDALLKLRQVCCDPRLVKLAAAREVVESAKLTALMHMLPEMIEAGRKVLLFSQFTSMLDLIKEALKVVGIRYVELTGDTADRAAPVRSFQAGEVPLFLISLKAGGRGLNLTAADTVIHYDPWWNPAAEDQATDRAHRIGQDKPVFVYKLIAAGTVEERIVELQKKKGSLAQTMLAGGEPMEAFDENDLDQLFMPLG